METISMSGKERMRLVGMRRVKSEVLSLAQAAESLDVSYRQVKRIWARYQTRAAADWCMGCVGRRRTDLQSLVPMRCFSVD